jgi:hypothetical protein
MTSCTVSGNVVTFDSSSPSIINSATNYSTGFNNNTGMSLAIDSSNIAVAIPTINSGARAVMTGYVNVNPTTQTWGAFSGNNSGAMTDSSTNNTYFNNPTFINTGTNIIVGSGYGSGGSLQFYCSTVAGGQNAHIYPGNPKDSTITSGVATMCLLSLSATVPTARVLTAYCDSSGSITTRVLGITSSGAISQNTTTAFSAAGMTTGLSGLYSLINLSGDTSIFLGYNGNVSPHKYYGCVITTSGLSAPTVNTYSSVVSIANENVQQWAGGAGAGFLQYSVIDSTHVAISFLTTNASTSQYSMWVSILSISGTTITAGTPVSVFTGYSNASQTFGVVNFSNGTGIVTYNNDAGPATSLLAKGFTYSGTTVTLGSANTLVTGLSLPNGVNNGNGNPMMVKVSPTQAMVITAEGFSASATVNLRMLTYVNVNSVTTGSAVAAGTATTNSTNYYVGFIPSSDNYNNTFYSYTMTSSPTNTWYQWYRG